MAEAQGVGLEHPADAAEAQNGLRRLATEAAMVYGVPWLKAGVGAAGMLAGAPWSSPLPLGHEARAIVRQRVTDVLA
jgi:hypothetical protein